MTISSQLFRQRIGLFNSNSVKYRSKNVESKKSNLFEFCSQKCTLLLLNILSINIDTFVLVSILFSYFFESPDPLLSSLIGTFTPIFCINLLQFSLIQAYSHLVMATRFFFTISILLDHVNLLEICVFFYYKILIILTHGDVHTNPGASPSSLFKFAHWNPNSLVAHNFSRIPILEAFMIKENLNLFAITESALKNSIPDRNIEIEGFSHIRNDLPPTDRCGGVLLYHRNDLPVKNRTDLQIPNSIVVEIHISRKKIFFIASYRKPSQTSPEFDQYIKNLDEILTKIKNENPYMTIMTGDFNAKHTEWYSEDNTDKFGDKIHELFAYHSLTQTVNKPTNITSRTKHCIDLVATDQPNLILNNDISPSLHTNCAHQINLVKLNLKCPPPSPLQADRLPLCQGQCDWSQRLSFSI